jgi:hypothetical protein
MTRKPHTSFATKFLIGSFVFFVLATAMAAYMFFGGVNLISPQNIDIEIVAPSLVDGSKEATFQILIRNRNQTALELTDLIVNFPEGTRSALDPSQELAHERTTIGTISSGEQLKRTVSAVFYGSEGSEQEIGVTLEYSVAGSNAVFKKEVQTSFVIGSSPVSLAVSAPSNITSGEQFSIEVEVRSNATAPVADVSLEAQYPFGFEALGATPRTHTGDNFWRLGTMQPGETKVVRIMGRIDGQDKDERIFRFIVGSVPDDTQTSVPVPFLTIPKTVTLEAPFISSSIQVEGQGGENITAEPGRPLEGLVSWKNNLSEPIANVELVLSFVGPALEKDSITASNGFYQSRDTSLIWTGDEVPELKFIEPGGAGSVQFSFATLPPGTGGVLITNPAIDLTLSVRGVRGDDRSPEVVSAASRARVTLASTPTVEAEALYFTGPFSNSGPLPPKAESKTTYSILWTVKNSSNTIGNARVYASLPVYVDFVSAQGGTGITYDEVSHTVRWNIGDLKPGVGYTLPARQAAFQVALTPSASQIGEVPQLTGEVFFSGQDRFAGVSVDSGTPAPTTRLNESGFNTGMDIVAPK